MSQTDVTEVADAVGGLQIDGPTTDTSGHTAALTFTDSDGEQRTVDITGQLLEDDPEATQPGTDTVLFDNSAYLAVPVIDKQPTDSLVIAFSGSVKYEASDPDGRALFAALALGKPVELRVAGFVAAKQGAYKENAEGESTVSGKATVKVDTVWHLSPEQL